MNNKNQAIDEMANIINEMPERNAHYYVKEEGRTIQKEAFADCYAIAEALYNADFRKVDDSNIVINKTEYERLICSENTLKRITTLSPTEAEMENKALKETIGIVLAQKKNIWNAYNKITQELRELPKKILTEIGNEACEHAYINSECEWFLQACKRYNVEVDDETN